MSITWQDGSVSSYVYTGYSTNQTNTTLEVDPQKNDRLYYYDAQNHLVEADENVTGWQGASYGSGSQPTYKTTYSYDALDDLVGVCQNGSGPSCTGGLQRTFNYDGLKRLTSAVNPESGTISYVYDKSNNVMSSLSARNITTSFSYDGLNRLTGKTYSDGITPWVANTYDCTTCGFGIGRLYLVQAGNSYNYRTYDLMGRVVTSSEYLTAPNGAKQGWAMSYKYDYADEPTSFTFPSGRVQNTSYDQAKRLTALFDNFNSVNVDLASNFGYYPNGAVEDVYLGNSNSSQTHQHTTLNSRLQVTGRSAQVHSTDGSPTLLTLGFNYPSSPSNNGNISSESITTNGGMGSSGINVTQSFGYDAFNRILSMSETSGLSQSYGYDAYGNRALTGGYAPSPYQTPTSTSQFTGNRWLGSGSSTAGYDASGNQTQNTNGGNVFTFDAENRMVTSNIGNMGVTSYVYDGEGRRIEKTSSTFTSYYVYDSSGDPVAEYTTETQPVYGTLYVTPDHLGSTRLLTNGNGDVVRRYDYLPFGEEIPSGSYSRGNDYGGNQYPNAGGSSFPGDAASHKFTGKERDTESGLDYFGARYYASNMGRWMSPDWAEKAEPVPYAKLDNPQSLNLYGYVLNNPLSRVDADGHEVDLTNTDAKQRAETEKRILSNVKKNERGLFTTTTDKNGTTSLVLNKDAAANFEGKHSSGYNMLNQAIDSKAVASVEINDHPTMPDGHSINTGADAGGGRTVNFANGNSNIYLSTAGDQSGLNLYGMNHQIIPNPVGIIAGHELLGHGRLNMLGRPSGEGPAVGVENQLRKEQGLPLRLPGYN